MKGSFWLFGAIFSFLGVSCENDSDIKANITGYWSVKSAFRDKRETRLLADVFFQFGADGKMLTNLPNTSDIATDYELKDHKITQKATSAITYDIQDLSDTTMVLIMEMNNTPFEIHLEKTNPPPTGAIESPVSPGDSL